MMGATRWTVCCSILLFHLFTTACQHVSLRSVYMDPTLYPVDAHRVFIDGRLNGEGTITFDGVNRCFRFNEFGDPGACNLASALPIDIRLEELNIEDNTDQGRTVYRLIGDLPGENHKYYLVVPSALKGSYRLVIDDGTPEDPIQTKKWGIVTMEWD